MRHLPVKVSLMPNVLAWGSFYPHRLSAVKVRNDTTPAHTQQVVLRHSLSPACYNVSGIWNTALSVWCETKGWFQNEALRRIRVYSQHRHYRRGNGKDYSMTRFGSYAQPPVMLWWLNRKKLDGLYKVNKTPLRASLILQTHFLRFYRTH
jgi:hypothetical protein